MRDKDSTDADLELETQNQKYISGGKAK